MKFKLRINFTMFILFFCILVVPAQALKIADFTLSDPFIRVGESFDVEVSVYDDGTLGDLTGFGFDVDPFGMLSNIFFDGFAIGPDYWDVSPFDNPNRIEGFYLGPFEDPSNSDNFVGNAGTDVLLATLSFTAGSVTGTDLLTIDGPFDGSFVSGLFYLNFDESLSGEIELNINPVPEPATILLLISGFAGLGVFGRKKFKK